MATTTERQTGRGVVGDVAPDLLHSWISTGDTLLVDVRNDFEHAEERIDGALLLPLPSFDAETVRDAAAGRRVVFCCKGGKRAGDAAARFAHEGGQCFVLQGGIDGWKASGLAVVKPASAPRLPVMRQVQFIAGLVVFVGTLLGAFVSPWWLVVPGFVGVGLSIAGLTGWCGLAMVLSIMPWNRVPKKSCGSACACGTA